MSAPVWLSASPTTRLVSSALCMYSRRCASVPLTDWLSVPSQCIVDSALLCAPSLTGCLCPLYVQLTGNQTGRGHTGALGHCQLYIWRAHKTSQRGAVWDTVYCTYIGYWQPAGVGACWAQRAQTTIQGGHTQSKRDPPRHYLITYGEH